MNVLVNPIDSCARPPFFVLSLRKISAFPAQACVIEMEDVFVKVVDATLVEPSTTQELAEFCQRQRNRGAQLFICVIHFGQLMRTLKAMPGWRKSFKGVHAYVMDGFLSPREVEARFLRRRFSPMFRALRAMDTLFIPVRKDVEAMSRCFGVRVEYVPLAADVAQFGSDRGERGIDVNAYGRQNVEHVNRLADLYNLSSSGRSLHYTSHFSFSKINDFHRHRAFFWKMLSMSRIALAYDPMQVNPEGRFFPGSFVGQRWFESLAAGCVVVGFKPDCAETSELLDWEDATIECPRDTDSFVAFIENLLDKPAYLEEVSRRNYRQMLLKHDWSYRIETIVRILGLDQFISPEMATRNARMKAQALASMATPMPEPLQAMAA